MNQSWRDILCLNECGKPVGRQCLMYCTQRCQHEHYRRTVIAKWRAGELPATYFTNRTLRNYLIELLGEKCQRCGWCERNPATKRVPLELEHIDGNWKNNSEQNLTLLCPNCHALTPTFRGLNRGRGRPNRKGPAKAAGYYDPFALVGSAQRPDDT
jgi:hypothetical protein